MKKTNCTQDTEDKLQANYKTPVVLSITVIVITFIWALNQKYLFDWDACFRAFTAFAGRDIITEFFKGNIHSFLDVKHILTHYSDFFEARPGSLVSYPPGQTVVIGIMSFISTNQFFLSLFNVFCYFLLSLGIWKTGIKLRFSFLQKLVAWSVICLHPTILLTIWSMRRGLFEAMVVSWCIIWLIDLYREAKLKYLLLLIITVTYGFLYRETLALVAVPTVIIFLIKLKSGKWNPNKHIILLSLAVIGIIAASLFTGAQVYLLSKGNLSILDKPTAYVKKLGGGPPESYLTMYGYYKGQFPPEKYLGLDEAELKKAGAPEVYRLAIGRWSLPISYKVFYLLNGIFINPLSILFLLLAIIILVKYKLKYRLEISTAFLLGLLYFVMLSPMGGIPDFITPIVVCLSIICAIPVSYYCNSIFKIFINCVYCIKFNHWQFFSIQFCKQYI